MPRSALARPDPTPGSYNCRLIKLGRVSAKDKAFVNLRAAVRVQLRALGLPDDAIEDVPGKGPEGCTRCDRERFYSYRRDGDASGRLIGVIVAR